MSRGLLRVLEDGFAGSGATGDYGVAPLADAVQGAGLDDDLRQDVGAILGFALYFAGTRSGDLASLHAAGEVLGHARKPETARGTVGTVSLPPWGS